MTSMRTMSVCEKQVFKQIFEDWNISIQRYLISRGLSSGDAADMVQDCFVRLWNNCAKIKVDQAGAYLFKLAKNISIDHFRKQQVRLKYKSTLSRGIEKQDGQFLLEESEFKEKIEQAISSMSDSAREVFIMHRFDNKSYKEIANILEISVKAVEKRMGKALRHLYNQKILKKK